MLMESNVRTEKQSILIEKAFEMYRDAYKSGGPPSLKILTYNPIRKNFVLPTTFCAT